jgi:hypothetical protein
MKIHKLSILAGLIVLLSSILACTINVGGPAYPDQRIPVSTEAVGDFMNAMQTSVAAGADSGQVTLVITEAQLSSYLAYQLQQSSQLPLTNPQVYLQDGKIEIYGTAQQGYFQATVQIVVTAGVDAQGQLKIDLASADFGPLPVPAGLKDMITTSVQEAYTGAIGPAATGFRLETITIANGTMTVTGRTK